MQNQELVKDYLTRCRARLKAIDVLMREKSWADTVRESQEVVELALKALLRSRNVLPPRIHDVSPVLEEHIKLFTAKERPHINTFIAYSRKLRRDRELAFYGSEDLTPSSFYKKEDASEALKIAQEIVATVSGWIGK